MPIVGGQLGYRVLGFFKPRDTARDEAAQRTCLPADELPRLFGNRFVQAIGGKAVVDFGCGTGELAVRMALAGAGSVVGVDIQPQRLEAARSLARQYAVQDRCAFHATTTEPVDVIVSKDAFEHYADPAGVLNSMSQLLRPGGRVFASFGPTWLHPYGGHLFSVFPWAHLLFTEAALLRWRSDFKTDGATRFREVEGGLNQMTIREFEQLVARSPLQIDHLDTVPIRGIGAFRLGPLREFGSSLVHCELTLRTSAA